jgi:hypothetical protein
MSPSDDPQTSREEPETTELDGSSDTELEVPQTDDPAVDKAVEEIIRSDGDEILKVQDEVVQHAVARKRGFGERFKNSWSAWWGEPRKRRGTILAVVIVIAALFVVPLTRYELLGFVFRKKVTVVVSDSKTGAPVSGAQVVVGAASAQTDALGKATLYVHTGSRYVTVSKKYYAGTRQTVLVTLSPGRNVYFEQLVARGRQVKVRVNNTITGKPVANAVVNAGGAIAKTGGDGSATVVFASGATTQSATVSLGGYNSDQVTINATGTLTQNTFNLTPAGKVYYLSNASGTIDVMKANLDGTDKQTVLSGTGDEDPQNTKLYASNDWKYVVLLSKRSGSAASLYLIDTTQDDKLTTIDSSNATFFPVGWSGDKFVYEIDRSSTVSDWQSGQEQLKSFDPTTGQVLLLDQTQGSGTSQTDWTAQNFTGAYLIGDQVVYAKGWNASSNDVSQLSTQSADLDTINADGSNHRVVKTFSIANGTTINYIIVSSELAEPNQLYLMFNDGTSANFYVYQNGSVTADTTLTQSMFTQTAYPNYYVSPSGNNSFWDATQDDLNTLYVGDQNGNNEKQVMSMSSFSPDGWYTDNYLLVTDSGSSLYIMSASGGTPYKITDMYQPSASFKG